MFRKALLAAIVFSLLGPASAAAGPGADTLTIRAGLTRAVATDRLDPADAHRYRLAVRRCRAVLTLLRDSRWTNLAAVLHIVARQSRSFNRPRALALFGMLELNTDYLAVHRMPPPRADVRDDDGIVYRAFSPYGLQFHPLGNFAALNADITHRNDERGQLHVQALAARGVRRDGTQVWEYYFPYGGGHRPWSSGMAQAAGAQAFARASVRYDDASLLQTAGRAYRAIPARLVMRFPAGPWIRHYSFSGLVVLNSQLQSVLSLATYATLAGDERAAALSARMRTTSATMFPRFDTGYWSHYSLGHDSPLRYHVYVIDLLRKLAARTGEAAWARRADRFHRYTIEPPLFKSGSASPTLYPWPADGHRDKARIRFWLSKVSSVTLTVAGVERRYELSGGWHAVDWWPGRRSPGTYTPTVSAVDLAGNRGSAALRPIVIRVDREPPLVRAGVAGRTLTWRAVDEGTPWLRLRLRLRRPGVFKVVALGIHPRSGSLRLPLSRDRWTAVLVAYDSSGNRTAVPLGVVATR